MAEDRELGLSRRSFLVAGASLLGLAAVGAWRAWLRGAAAPELEGAIVGPSMKLGHLLRAGGFPAPSGPVERTTVAILGAGISGLSAAWKLERSGLRDFRVLELEETPGGNARWGESEVTPYPWGAHYVPLPRPETRAVSELLRELKVELGRDAAGRPVYDDRFLCLAPTERLFLHGRWQEGLFPRLGASERDLGQLRGFEAAMARWRARRGSDGRRAFALPMELSSRDPELLALDRLTMAEYLRRNGWDSPRLRWYVEYACRDDYGSLLEETSAWAGLHYFAARGEGPEDQVLTWPEGNGWLARRLAAVAGGRLKSRTLAYRVSPAEDGVEIEYLDAASGRAHRLRARAALVCLPQFAAARLLAPWAKAPPPWLPAFEYSSWMVANLSVDAPPEGHGAPPAWDNVLYQSDSLGYVDAKHQTLSQDRRRSVWTYYLPLTGRAPRELRAKALATGWTDWKDRTLAELSRAHPGLERHVRRLDVMVWGHGMVKPKPGFLWGADRRKAAEPLGRVYFGHSDLSGFSLFEEAQHRGLKAAQDAMKALGHPHVPSV
ncbi:MAG: FAD-dependent oxidoreductase [Elusimicrobia bacterium]|nr:FAD-dependent oxidoreductase [Elusimicrobiota bacterium]